LHCATTCGWQTEIIEAASIGRFVGIALGELAQHNAVADDHRQNGVHPVDMTLDDAHCSSSATDTISCTLASSSMVATVALCVS